LRRATEPFFTTKGPGKGTGLGLSMAQGIAEQSGGRFVLQSKPGKGTTAEIWLPVANVGAPAIEQAQPSATVESESAQRLVVVAVDDDFLVLTNTVTMLEDLGHTALAASSGKEALDILRQHGPVDLVVTDQAMPSMTGLQLAETIQKEWPDIPIILTSGYAELESGTSGELQLLSKPFTEAGLAAALTRAVQPRGSGRVLKFRSGRDCAG
jgi:CheY-like chemotaxis protein